MAIELNQAPLFAGTRRGAFVLIAAGLIPRNLLRKVIFADSFSVYV